LGYYGPCVQAMHQLRFRPVVRKKDSRVILSTKIKRRKKCLEE
jgi:hypothetical protein